MLHMPESRFVAFGAHLFLSAFVFSCLALFTYFILLPGFLFYSESGLTILTLIGGVDVVLGPLITLIIYKKTKPSIKLDLSLIALLQIAALIYGVYALWSVRPLAVFYTKDSYHVVYQSTFQNPTYSDISDIGELNKLRPPVIAISLPENIENPNTLLLEYSFRNGKSYFSQQALYKSYAEVIPQLREEGFGLDEATRKNIIKQGSKISKMDANRYRVFRFRGSLNSGYLVIDTLTGKFVDIII